MIAAALVLLAQAFMLSGAGSALAGPFGSATEPLLKVFVANDASNPVPVTGSVNVGNSPTVKAQQNGDWTVSLNGTPVVGIDPQGNTVKLDSNGNTVKLDPNGNTVKLDSSANTVNVGNTPTVNVGNSPTVKLDTSGGPIPVTTGAVTETVYDTVAIDPGSITIPSGGMNLPNRYLDVSKYEKLRIVLDSRPDSNSDVTLYAMVAPGEVIATLHVAPGAWDTAEVDVPGTQILIAVVPDGDAPDYVDMTVYGR